MVEKVYKTMKSVGASNIVLGILLIVGCDCRRCRTDRQRC